MKLSRISQIVRILTLLQPGQSYCADEFAELLGVSRRTFFRDMNELSAIGLPYRFDVSGGGYSLAPEFFLPSVDPPPTSLKSDGTLPGNSLGIPMDR